MRHLFTALASLAAAVVTTSAAHAGLPIPPELQPICDRLSSVGVCMDGPCVCTVENGAGDENNKLLESAYIMRAAHPNGGTAGNHLIIKTNGAWVDYGNVFTDFAETPDGSKGTGSIKRFWMKYRVANFGTVLVCDFELDHLFRNPSDNSQVRRKSGGMVFAFVHQGALRVLEIQRYLDETVSRIDKKGPKPDVNTHGREGRNHWKRQVEVLDTGRVRVTKATGDHPKLKKPHPLVASPVLDIMHAFDDEVIVRQPEGL